MKEQTSGMGRGPASRDFAVCCRLDDLRHVLEMSGELDLGSRAAAIEACTSGDHLDVIIDLSELEFMDCAGYEALVTSMAVLERSGGSLVLMNSVEEPKRLLALIEGLQLGRCVSVPDDVARPSVSTPCTAAASQ